MKRATIQVDLFKLMLYYLKHIWLLILCGAIGFVGQYWSSTSKQVDMYTASGTMYVYNGNPNVVNFQYTNTADLNSALQLLNTYMVVVKSNKVMDAVVDRLVTNYPGITAAYIASTLSMGSVSQTGVLRVSCTTDSSQKSADICNAVLDVAPSEIIRVVSAGNIEIIDYATPPDYPDSRSPLRRSILFGAVGVVIAGAFLLVIFLLNQKITDVKELEDHYTPPVLASLRRNTQPVLEKLRRDRTIFYEKVKKGKVSPLSAMRDTRNKKEDPASFILSKNSPVDVIEEYAKLRMNLLYTLVGKENHIVEVTSAISGEGKSTIVASLAISCMMAGKKVLLIDGDMRRACQREIFHYDRELPGLADVLVGQSTFEKTVFHSEYDNLDLLPAGSTPPNPSELLGSNEMHELLDRAGEKYDLILLDAPPVNIVSDPLVLSSKVAGCLFVVRQNYSDHRELRKALISAEMTGLNVLGFVYYSESEPLKRYYRQKYYDKYYKEYTHKSETRETGNPRNKAGK